ncbi:MAG: Tim44 domain-containing protein [Leptothrix sp. (in: b-proteobacteria)]
MKHSLLAVLMAAIALLSAGTDDAHARRLGGGGSAGMQRSMPARSTPQDAGRPSTPPQQAPAAAPQGAQPSPAFNGANAAAAAKPKRNWMGPLAGLAAGLGIAALMSSFGMGGALSNMVMMALIAVAAVALIGWLMRRFVKPGAQAASGRDYAFAGGPAADARPEAQTDAPVAWPGAPGRAEPPLTPATQTATHSATPLTSAGWGAQPGSAAASFGKPATDAAATPAIEDARTAPSLPADFDHAGFARLAKMIFIRMQAANDSADLNDLRSFTTPELFAHIRVDLQERGNASQVTDVVEVNAQVIDFVREAERDVVSVRYQGRIREELNGPVAPFDEIWHLVQPRNSGTVWAIAGIQPTH